MPVPKYALNHQEVENKFPRTSDKERRIKKLKNLILNDQRQIHKDNLRLSTHKLELKILTGLIEKSPNPNSNMRSNQECKKRNAIKISVKN